MYYVEVEKNINIFVQDINPAGKKTMVMIHGWPLSHKMYEYQFNILPEFDYRIIALDLRGFGASDRPFTGYSYEKLADDLHTVFEKLNLKDIVLVGFSMGGAIAIKYASKYQNARLKKLVLLSAAAPSFVKREGYPYGMSVEEVNRLMLQIYNNRPEAIHTFGKMFFVKEMEESFRNWFESICMEASSYGTIKTLARLRDENLFPDLKNIKVKTGIFFGTKDRICAPEFAKILHENIENSKLYQFNQSGHAIFFDELEKFNHNFIEFIDEP